MMTKEEKNSVIKDLREKIEKANALFVTNLVGIEANDAVSIRKRIRDAKGNIVVTRNTFFRKASEGTYAQELLKDLKGTSAVAFAFEDAPAVAKVIFESSKDLEPVVLGKGILDGKILSEAEVSALAKLPSRNEMLGTLLATFNAPISAFARVLNAIKEEVEKQAVTKPSELKVSAEA